MGDVPLNQRTVRVTVIGRARLGAECCTGLSAQLRVFNQVPMQPKRRRLWSVKNRCAVAGAIYKGEKVVKGRSMLDLGTMN